MFWLVHSSERWEVITACLDNLAIQLTDSPHHSLWPDAPSRILGDSFSAADAMRAPTQAADGAPDGAAPLVRRMLPSPIVIDVSYSETSAIEGSLWGAGWAGYGLERGLPAKVA